jgi:hypothetical protein
VPTSTGNGSFSFTNESSSWESLLSFDPADAGQGRTATVHVACRTSGVTSGDTVLVVEAPRVGALFARVGLMVMGPLLLGGAGFVWLLVLIVLHVVRRTARP